MQESQLVKPQTEVGLAPSAWRRRSRPSRVSRPRVSFLACFFLSLSYCSEGTLRDFSCIDLELRGMESGVSRQPQSKAAVSWIGAAGVCGGLEYCFECPVRVSVTVAVEARS